MQERQLTCVQGNHDLKVTRDWLPQTVSLSTKSIQYLANLPISLTFQWQTLSGFLCHSNPWHDTSIYIFPERPRVLFEFIVKETKEDIVILGHTHYPMWVEIDGRTIINPGSIYENRNIHQRTCGLLSIPEKTFTLYDIDTCEIVPIERKVI